MRARRRRSLATLGLHASCPSRKPPQIRPTLRREGRLYQRDVLSRFARAAPVIAVPSRFTPRRNRSRHGEIVTSQHYLLSKAEFILRPLAFSPSKKKKKNWQVPACHSSSWFPRFVVVSLFRKMRERSRVSEIE